MKNILLKLFDPGLTPGSARIQGYEYLDDILVSMQSAKQSTKIFLKLLLEHHLKLGLPNNTENEYFGLYVPLKEIDKLRKLSI